MPTPHPKPQPERRNARSEQRRPRNPSNPSDGHRQELERESKKQPHAQSGKRDRFSGETTSRH